MPPAWLPLPLPLPPPGSPWTNLPSPSCLAPCRSGICLMTNNSINVCRYSYAAAAIGIVASLVMVFAMVRMRCFASLLRHSCHASGHCALRVPSCRLEAWSAGACTALVHAAAPGKARRHMRAAPLCRSACPAR